jgi:hypothetical protein
MNDFVTDLERACPDVPTGVPAPRADTDHGPVQLVPAPPGADPLAMAGLRTIADESAMQVKSATPTATTARAEGPRATSKRVADEPRFVTEQKPMTFDHVFTDAAEAPRTRSKLPWILLAIVVAGGGGVALALVMKGGSGDQVASVKPIDAGVVIVDAARPRPVDAAVVIDVPVDAGALAVDAGVRHVGHPPSTPHDAGIAIKKVHVPPDKLTVRGTVQVQVITKPDGAGLYVNDEYRGSGNVTLEEQPGTVMKVKCTLSGYDPGTVDVKFDGVQDVVLCTPKRTKRCVDGLQNPFDDCTPEPSK